MRPSEAAALTFVVLTGGVGVLWGFGEVIYNAGTHDALVKEFQTVKEKHCACPADSASLEPKKEIGNADNPK